MFCASTSGRGFLSTLCGRFLKSQQEHRIYHMKITHSKEMISKQRVANTGRQPCVGYRPKFQQHAERYNGTCEIEKKWMREKSKVRKLKLIVMLVPILLLHSVFPFLIKSCRLVLDSYLSKEELITQLSLFSTSQLYFEWSATISKLIFLSALFLSTSARIFALTIQIRVLRIGFLTSNFLLQ